jgi:hypothetical protein
LLLRCFFVACHALLLLPLLLPQEPQQAVIRKSLSLVSTMTLAYSQCISYGMLSTALDSQLLRLQHSASSAAVSRVPSRGFSLQDTHQHINFPTMVTIREGEHF